MSHPHVNRIAVELGIRDAQVAATAELLAAGGTVPFISRYRKEATGGLDEVAITQVRDRLAQLAELDDRRGAILKSLEERELLTDDLRARLEAAETMAVLEDIYLPFRPKRRTRATIARERGLEPLAVLVMGQGDADPLAEAAAFVDPEKEVNSPEEALAGARDIIAEWVNEDEDARAAMRDLFTRKATIRSRLVPGKEAEGAKFRDYFEWEEPAHSAPSHRVLAIRRGEEEGVLSFRILPPEADAVALLVGHFVHVEPGQTNACSEQVRLAVEDCYKRLLSLSMETEMRMSGKQAADEDAITVFTDNLRQLLLAAPLGERRVLAIDPGFRTGCKVVCLDAQGKLLYHDVVYPTLGERQRAEAGQKLEAVCRQFDIEAVAIGNGTASRETEEFVRRLPLREGTLIVMTDEAGASVYSASDVAREEFPEHDVTVRGAVSIGRRLMDPLAELVKIDPKSIGVGQYQHDVDQTRLRRSLDDTVMSAVNRVGVEVNTASKQLLTYVSGLGPKLAQAIVEFRDANGPFRDRHALLSVPRLGPRAFEQAAGFLRIHDAPNPLDASAVHPESYAVVDHMAADMGCSVKDLMTDASLRKGLQLSRYVTDTVGLPTLQDILAELEKPGRDPRDRFEAFQFAEGVHEVKDLQVGMKLPGIVTNITRFGVFVDVGVHQDGLVHVSQVADRFVSDPGEVVKLRQQVQVTVLEVDLERNRIALSMRQNPTEARRRSADSGQPAPSRPSGGGREGKRDRRRDDRKSDSARRQTPPTAMGRALMDALRQDGK